MDTAEPLPYTVDGRKCPLRSESVDARVPCMAALVRRLLRVGRVAHGFLWRRVAGACHITDVRTSVQNCFGNGEWTKCY